MAVSARTRTLTDTHARATPQTHDTHRATAGRRAHSHPRSRSLSGAGPAAAAARRRWHPSRIPVGTGEQRRLAALSAIQFNRHLLSAYYAPGLRLGTGEHREESGGSHSQIVLVPREKPCGGLEEQSLGLKCIMGRLLFVYTSVSPPSMGGQGGARLVQDSMGHLLGVE